MIRRFDGFDIDHFQLGSLTSVHNKWDFFWYSNKCCKVESFALLTVAIFSMSKQFSPFPAQYWDQLSSKVFSSSSHKDYLQIENRLLLWIIHYFHHLMNCTSQYYLPKWKERESCFWVPLLPSFVFQFLLILPQNWNFSLMFFTPVFLLAAFQNLIE